MLAAPAHAQASGLAISGGQDGASGSSLLSIENADMTPYASTSLAIEDAEQRAMARPAMTLVNVLDTPNIIINNNFAPNDIRDPTNITGIGQVVRDAGGGSVGLCTGTLINPRTVIFAAHCVNGSAAVATPATTYGPGGTAMAVAFETNTRANAAGQSDELVNWLTGGSTGPGRFQTNTAQALYNVLQVFYNPQSRSATACNVNGCFLEGDVAIAALDTPTRNIPTWTLLFSPLTSPTSINPATGTGYHVTIAGYGNNGVGTTGAAGTDFRRRVAENMLGALTSNASRNTFIFGGPADGDGIVRNQVVYRIDFDDPARTSTRDINVYRDNALTREGVGAPGDSGGPLIIDQAFARPVIIGVLSGGGGFFAGAPASGYGTDSFYQPLFLYWDWIVANNPYRYVTAAAGNRNWEDATTWVTTLDPAYQILAGGQLVNGLPPELGGGPGTGTPQFGEVCVQQPQFGVNECQNLGTGAARNNVPNNPNGEAQLSDAGSVITEAQQANAVQTAAATGGSGFGIDQVDASPNAAPGYRDGPLPAATLANGLPGATNFVANNSNGVRTTGVSARFYDVTLRNAGTITLSTAVTIDRFAVAVATAGLNVATAGSLTSLIDVTQTAGTVNVNGTLTSGGDYALIGGLLSGTGTVRTPFLTSVLGTIAPGTIGTIGTLTVAGNVVLSSGTQTAIDLGANGVSDRLTVIANGTSTGTANLGGSLVLTPVSRATFGSTYTVLQAAGGRTGTFATANALSAILRPEVTYTANAVNVRIIALPYASVVNPNSPVQTAYARLLDANRGNYALLADLFGELDALPTAAAIQATLDAAAPRTEATSRAIVRMTTDSMGRFLRDRISFMGSDEAGGTLTMIGNPVQLASTAMNNMGGMDSMQTMSDGASNLVQAHGALPENVSGYLAGGVLDGRSDTLPGLTGRDELDGWYVSAGLELDLTEDTRVGVGVHYVDTSGQSTAAQSTDGSLVQGNFYSISQLGHGLVGTTQLSVGEYAVESRRTVVVGATTFNLNGRNDALAASGEVGFGYQIPIGDLMLTPNVAGRYTVVDFGDSRETGGGLALITAGEQYESLQGRLGIDFGGTARVSERMTVTPRFTATWVHEFNDQPTSFTAGFAATGFNGGAVGFLLPNSDRNWAEVGGGLRFAGPRVSVDFTADTTLQRGDLSYRTYRASVGIRF
jgi:uncharacterized protein with beta-barrel porin domain